MESAEQKMKQLSPTEQAIAQRFAAGYRLKEIAAERDIETCTVSWHMAKARRKLNVKGREQGRTAIREALAKLATRKKEPANG